METQNSASAFIKFIRRKYYLNPGFPGYGYQYMFDAAMDDILAERTASAVVTHDLSLQVMKIIDQVGSALEPVNPARINNNPI